MQMPKPDFSKVAPSGSRTPLKEFKGVLISHEAKIVTFGETSRTDVVFTFKDLDVIASDVPYLLPMGEVPIPYKETDSSQYGLLGKSFAAVLGLADYKDVDIEATYGRVHHWLRTDDHKYGDRRVKNEAGDTVIEELKGVKWDVLEIEGATGAQGKPKEHPILTALKLLDGKNAGDFYRAALQDRAIKADATLTDQIMNETFVPAMVAINAVSIDDNGVHHVDWEKAPKL